MSRIGWLVTLLFALATAGTVYWFVNNFERHEVERYMGYQGEARTNPLLAARRFLQGMGVPVETVDHLQELDELPPAGDVLLIWTQRHTLSDTRSQALLDWVNQGGHLIVLARYPEWNWETEEMEELADTLLDSQGIYVAYHEEEWDDEQDEDRPFEATLPDTTKPLTVDFYTNYRLEGWTDEDFVLADDYGVHVGHRWLGEGRLTVATDLDFITNDGIGEHDHAEFLWEMVHWQDAVPGKVWLVHNDDMPPLWLWLWIHAWPLVIVLSLLWLAWLFSAVRRFGPMQPVPPAARRRVLEHIEAAGHFLWKRNQRRRLIEGVRQALHRRLMALHPGWAELDPKEREKHLAKLCDLSEEQVSQLLHRGEFKSPQDFTALIQHLEDVRKKL